MRLATTAVAAAAAAAAAASVPNCPQDYLLASKLEHHLLACPLWETFLFFKAVRWHWAKHFLF